MIYNLKSQEIINRCVDDIRTSIGKSVEIKEMKRSLPQNRLYWNLLNILAKDMGYDSDTLHTTLKVRWLGVSRRIIEGVEIVEPVSTTTLTTKQMTEYIDKIYELGAIMGIVLPNPSYWGLECTD